MVMTDWTYPDGDDRNCPKCSSLHAMDAENIPMELKATIDENYELWQCPVCKNVEIRYVG